MTRSKTRRNATYITEVKHVMLYKCNESNEIRYIEVASRLHGMTIRCFNVSNLYNIYVYNV